MKIFYNLRASAPREANSSFWEVDPFLAMFQFGGQNRKSLKLCLFEKMPGKHGGISIHYLCFYIICFSLRHKHLRAQKITLEFA